MTEVPENTDCNPVEKALLERLSQGDVHAFDAIYRKYFQAVYRNASMLLKDPSAAEDVVQETFLSLWNSRKKMAGRESAGGWLFITCHNRCINLIKRRLTEQKARREWAIPAYEAQDGGALFERGLSILEKAMEGLSLRQRQAITLCKLQGKSYEEAANIMDVSKHTVKEYLSIGMRSIRQFVKERAVRSLLTIALLTARMTGLY
jgi:RNA polymerase sigma-70 factor (ECF subfamily)